MANIIKRVEAFGAIGIGDVDDPKTVYHYEFISEETADVAELPTNYSNEHVGIGSTAHCMEDKKDYYLPTTGVWTEKDAKPTAEAVTGIDITKEPAVKKYYQGDTLDTTGFAAVATYNSLRKADVDAGDVTFSVNSGTTSSLVVADTTVTATYSGETDSYAIDVEPKLSSIAISGMTTTYTEGELFSTDGIVVTASYAGANNAEVTDYDIDLGGLTEGEALTVEDNGAVITVTYTESTEGLADVTKTTTATLTVTAAQADS